MFSFTNAATNASTTTASLTWNQETYNKIICRNNKTKDWASKMNYIIQAIKAIVGLEEKAECHKLHSAISPSILHRFSRSQWLRKALEKTFRSVPVTSRGDQ